MPKSSAVTWACEKFSEYLIGMDFLIETDHKPLVPILGQKGLCEVTPRIMRFKMRLMWFRFKIIHIPGKEMYSADALSRAPVQTSETNKLQEEVENFVCLVVNSFPCSDRRLSEIRENQHENVVCMKIREFVVNGWPDKHNIDCVLKPYYPFHSEFSIIDGLLVKNDRLVIPICMRDEILGSLGHCKMQWKSQK